jgi:hypothetical protein
MGIQVLVKTTDLPPSGFSPAPRQFALAASKRSAGLWQRDQNGEGRHRIPPCKGASEPGRNQLLLEISRTRPADRYR